MTRLASIESHLAGRVTLHRGDCLEVLARLPADGIDAVVTDPPYHLNFMGKTWDGGEIAFEPATWAAMLRVLKPGGHLLAFGAPKNFGFMQHAIALAGFEIRDVLAWLFGSGFPKSHDVSKGIDRAAPRGKGFNAAGVGRSNGGDVFRSDHPDYQPYAPATDAAREWQGWGTALKPAYEPIIMARKPLSEKTVASNVLRWGTGAINIDGCRIWADTDRTDIGCSVGTKEPSASSNSSMSSSGKHSTDQSQTDMKSTIRTATEETTTSQICNSFPSSSIGNCTSENITPKNKTSRPDVSKQEPAESASDLTPHGLRKREPEAAQNITASTVKGRWPANLLHDGSDEVVAGFPETASVGHFPKDRGALGTNGIYGKGSIARDLEEKHFAEGGSAARFFYTAKADSDDRLGSKHPTVKPLDLMQWLVRLVTPKGGLVLDPFAGTGTTGEAAWREGMRAILIEREDEYCADIARRMALALSGPDERLHQTMKEKLKGKPLDHGPLFSEIWDAPFYKDGDA